MGKEWIDEKFLIDSSTELLAIPSPSGYTDGVVHFVAEKLEKLGIHYELTRRGAIRATIPGKESGPGRAIVAHLDTLGAMVKNLKENGRLEITPIGHWSSRFAEGGRVTIFKDDGSARGTVLPLKASGHTFNKEIDTQPVAWSNLEVRVDDIVRNKTDLIEHGFNVGDFIAFDPGLEITANGFINSRYLGKAGVATVLAVAKAIKEQKVELPVDFHLLFTISEEVGSGASAILHGDIAEMVSVGNAAADPRHKGVDYDVMIVTKDSSGPFDWHLSKKLIEICMANNIGHNRNVFSNYRCDSVSAIEAGNDLRTVLLCFPVDGADGYDRTHKSSLINLGRVLYHYMKSSPVLLRDRNELSPGIKGFSQQPLHSEELPPVFRRDQKN